MAARFPRRFLLTLCTLAVLGTGMAAPVAAQDQQGRAGQTQQARRQGPDFGRMERQQRGQESLADSVRRFERSRGGRVLSAERMQSDGRDVNRIKAMDSRGRVRVYVDDPQRREPVPQGRRNPRGGDD